MLQAGWRLVLLLMLLLRCCCSGVAAQLQWLLLMIVIEVMIVSRRSRCDGVCSCVWSALSAAEDLCSSKGDTARSLAL